MELSVGSMTVWRLGEQPKSCSEKYGSRNAQSDWREGHVREGRLVGVGN